MNELALIRWNLKNMISQDKITYISNILKKIPGLASAYLHGSALTNYFRIKSDIDIALLFFPNKNKEFFTEDFLDYSIEIESITGHIAHFGQLSSYHTVFSQKVVTSGQLIICNDKYFCDTFTMHTLSMYANLNYELREILETYTA
jgi:predicted nucleotidyltransferase